jgi:adenine-specific DNA-methyltransferase
LANQRENCEFGRRHRSARCIHQEQGRWSISYLRKAEKERIKRRAEVTGRDRNGALILKQSENIARVKNPVTVWNQRSHNAGAGGSNVIRAFLPRRKFPFPKSLYAVEDALRFFVKEKPGAVILDFFSGSGTTAHAVMRLNKQDGGRRQCICVTNNEVGANEQETLRKRDLRPGDAEWEQWGICGACHEATRTGRHRRQERRTASPSRATTNSPINSRWQTACGKTPSSLPDLRNAGRRQLQTAFARIAPLLWVRAGSGGRRIENCPPRAGKWSAAAGCWWNWTRRDFLRILASRGARIAYIVTDDERRSGTVRACPKESRRSGCTGQSPDQLCIRQWRLMHEFTLHEYQGYAVGVFGEPEEARKRWHEDGGRHAFVDRGNRREARP